MTLGKLFPTLTQELTSALIDDGRRELVDQLSALSVVRRCCEYASCASFYTLDVTNQDIADCGKRIVIAKVPGLLCLFTIDDSIAFIELLNRPDLRGILDDIVPSVER